MSILKGWKTRAVAVATGVLGLLSLLDPDILTSALGLTSRGHSILLIGLAVTMWLLREVTDTAAGKKE